MRQAYHYWQDQPDSLRRLRPTLVGRPARARRSRSFLRHSRRRPRRLSARPAGRAEAGVSYAPSIEGSPIGSGSVACRPPCAAVCLAFAVPALTQPQSQHDRSAWPTGALARRSIDRLLHISPNTRRPIRFRTRTEINLECRALFDYERHASRPAGTLPIISPASEATSAARASTPSPAISRRHRNSSTTPMRYTVKPFVTHTIRLTRTNGQLGSGGLRASASSSASRPAGTLPIISPASEATSAARASKPSPAISRRHRNRQRRICVTR